jgi:hypothetical protein
MKDGRSLNPDDHDGTTRDARRLKQATDKSLTPFTVAAETVTPLNTFGS